MEDLNGYEGEQEQYVSFVITHSIGSVASLYASVAFFSLFTSTFASSACAKEALKLESLATDFAVLPGFLNVIVASELISLM